MNSKTQHSVLMMALILAVMIFFTACKSKAERVQEQLDLGQKYLTESNYTEAILAFTKAIEIDPESIPAYMGRAQAYRGTEQYEEAKTDYTTVIDKTEEQPYTQAEAYVGRAEVDELTEDQQGSLGDYQSAATVLDKVDLEKITDVTQQMLEALKAKVYDAIARLSALFEQHEAAVTAYTSALESLDLLPDDAEVIDVPAAKVESYTGRAASNLELENYEAVLPDYDALVELGEDKTQERDALLAALSLSRSQAADLGNSDSWLEEVNHGDYAQSIQMDAMVGTLAQAAALAQTDGTDAYDDIQALLTTDENQAAMRNLLARGYQLRYYDAANSRMLAVYAGDTAWADVHEETNGLITPEALETPAAVPTQEELDQVAVSPLYVYYGEYKGRSREGEGLWYILNPGSREYEARSYQWEKDAPVDGFAQVPVQTKPAAAPAPVQTASQPSASVRITNLTFDRNAYLSRGDTTYTVTVEYNCPANETFRLTVGYYYEPSAYSTSTNMMTEVSGSGTYQCSFQVYMDIPLSKLQGTNFGVTAILGNKEIDASTGRSTITAEDNLYIDAAGNLTRNKTDS